MARPMHLCEFEMRRLPPNSSRTCFPCRAKMGAMRFCPFSLILVLISAPVWAAEPTRYTARDSLKAPAPTDTGAADLFRTAGYEPREFSVSVAPPGEDEGAADALVRFPSPRPDPATDAGQRVNTVVLKW